MNIKHQKKHINKNGKKFQDHPILLMLISNTDKRNIIYKHWEKNLGR